jgi:hypothetical protein
MISCNFKFKLREDAWCVPIKRAYFVNHYQRRPVVHFKTSFFIYFFIFVMSRVTVPVENALAVDSRQKLQGTKDKRGLHETRCLGL